MSMTPTRPGGARRKPSEFLLPDGRRVLVALPEDVQRLRQRYAGGGDADPPIQIEVVVHGSDEHRRLLAVSRGHHAARRAALCDRLGADAVDELEDARAQLDAVDEQLRRLDAGVDAEGVASRLNANFEKFGFDAKLRTYADDEDGSNGGGGGGGGGGSSTPPPGLSTVSSRVSLANGEVAEEEWSKSREGGDPIRLFRRPVIKQYFHRGLLWRSAEETKVMSFELFFDLLYVGVIAINGDHAAEEPTGLELLRFTITFIMSWKIWSDVQQLASWFETNDIMQRVEMLFLIACLLGQTTNMLQTFAAENDTFTQLVAFYLAARLFVAAYCALTGFLLPLVKGMMIAQVINVLVGAALLIASTFMTPTHPLGEGESSTEATAAAEEGGAQQAQSAARIALVFVALGVDIFGSAVPIFLFRFSSSHTTPVARRVSRFFEFYPAINIEHKVERTNAFVTLVLGYTVVGVIYQNASSMGFNAFLGKAILGLTQAFVFNWLYFDVDGNNIRTHAIRWRVETAFIWMYAHLSFIMSFILASAALSKMVVVTDCANSPLDALTPFYQERSAETVSRGLRLYYCVGLGVALFSMGLISLSHEHREPADICRLPKWARLLNRFAVCVVFFCLPAAGDALNSLSLVAITTSLSVWTLFFELWGMSCNGDSFFGGAADEPCRYTATCGRRRLEEATKSDGEIDIVQLGRSEKTAAITVS